MEVASRFRSHDFSDAFISLQLTGANDGIDSGGEETEELDRFPGHLIVTQSPYFQTQVRPTLLGRGLILLVLIFLLQNARKPGTTSASGSGQQQQQQHDGCLQ
eukprot:GHUV01027921.1.p6 GENE.GHUV01027921.1~~GHUV01027921.1.p6  ORF type:complete len:103 (+),score=23.77 GHUV01027921.1:2085-2393(+)